MIPLRPYFKSPGSKIERFRVLSAIGALGGNLSLVKLIFNALESSINHKIEFIILEETNNVS